jgi:hypothetical protein
VKTKELVVQTASQAVSLHPIPQEKRKEAEMVVTTTLPGICLWTTATTLSFPHACSVSPHAAEEREEQRQKEKSY